MNIKQITELSLKILALYWVLNAVSGLSSSFIFFYDSPVEKEKLITHLMSNIAPVLVIAIVLFFIAKPFSKYVTPSLTTGNQTSVATLDIKALELHSVLLSIFGFILIKFSYLLPY